MGRFRRSSVDKKPALPVAVSEALRRQVRILSQRLIDNIPGIPLTHRQLDDMLADPADNAVVRDFASRNPERIYGDCYVLLGVLEDTPDHAAWLTDKTSDPKKLPAGALTLHLDTHGILSTNTGDGHHDLRFMHLRGGDVGTAHLPRPDADPAHVAAIRDYALARYKAGIQAAAVRAFCITATEICTTVPQLLRIWPNSLRWASVEDGARRALSEHHNKRGRRPEQWSDALDRAVVSADFLLGKGALLETRGTKTGEFVTMINRIGPYPRLPWSGREFTPD